MINVYRVKELDEQTEVYGIIAGDTTYTMSPYIHNAAFKATGRNAVFVPFQVSDLDAFMQRMVLPETREIDLNFRGFSVTIPHKEAVIKHLDVLSETARQTGAVNTIAVVNGKLHGHNTDADGFMSALENSWDNFDERTRFAVVGSGGAARACSFALKGPNLTIIARDLSKAQELAKAFDADAELLTDEKPFDFSRFDVVVNTTPLGTKGTDHDGTIASAEQLRGVKLVYDLVYNPQETRLLCEAKKAGAETLGGFDMLIAQAAHQFKIWTGQNAPVDEMSAAAKKRLYDG
jgi:shikimate dehydrogenase